MKTHNELVAEAYLYWLEKGELPRAAMELARDQVDFESAESDDFFNPWKGPNDSIPLHSY